LSYTDLYTKDDMSMEICEVDRGNLKNLVISNYNRYKKYVRKWSKYNNYYNIYILHIVFIFIK